MTGVDAGRRGALGSASFNPEVARALVLVVAVVAAVTAAARTQQIGPVTIPQDTPTVAPPAARAAAKSLDQLLDRLEDLRAQKAELDRQEAEVVKEIRRKMERQTDRLQRLGVGTDGITPGVIPAAPSVSFSPVMLPTLAPPVAPSPAAAPVIITPGPASGTRSAAPAGTVAQHPELARLAALGIPLLPAAPEPIPFLTFPNYVGLFGGN